MKPEQQTNRGAKALAFAGLRILVGRASHQASALSSGLRDRGAEVLDIPFIEIRAPRSYKSLDGALQNLSDYDWLVLTSVNGLKVDMVPKEYVAESVVASLQRKVRGKRVLLARAKVARDVIPRELRKLGARVDVVEAYETIIPQVSRKRLRAALTSAKERLDLITFTSSSTARNFVMLLGRGRRRGRPHQTTQSHTKQLDGVRLASIGPVTSSTLRGLGLRVDIEASEYTIPGLIEAIVAHAEKRR